MTHPGHGVTGQLASDDHNLVSILRLICGAIDKLSDAIEAPAMDAAKRIELAHQARDAAAIAEKWLAVTDTGRKDDGAQEEQG